MNKLSSCLKVNNQILGPDCANLGKSTGSFLCRRKIMLSYTNERGWEVLRLNIVQLFLRFLGFYKHTQLNFIAQKINNLATSSKAFEASKKIYDNLKSSDDLDDINKIIPPFIVTKLNEVEIYDDIQSCVSRIRKIWTKSNTLSNNVIALGNTNILQAEIIGFAESHLNESFIASAVQIINTLYREGDIILLEALKAGEVINSYRNLNTNCIIRGWEPENIEMACHKRSKQIEKQLLDGLDGVTNVMMELDIYKEVKRNQESEEVLSSEESEVEWEWDLEKNPLSEAELDLLEKQLETSIQKIHELNKYYRSDSPEVLQADEILRKIFKQVKEGTGIRSVLNALGCLSLIQSFIYTTFGIDKKAFYKNMTEDDIKEIDETIKKRNASLVAEIKKHSKKGKKVFVVAGASHLLNFPDQINCDEVKKTLHEHKFIIITAKNLYDRTVAKLNPDIKPIKIALVA